MAVALAVSFLTSANEANSTFKCEKIAKRTFFAFLFQIFTGAVALQFSLFSFSLQQFLLLVFTVFTFLTFIPGVFIGLMEQYYLEHTCHIYIIVVFDISFALKIIHNSTLHCGQETKIARNRFQLPRYFLSVSPH